MEDDELNTSSNPQPPPLTAEEKAILESDKIGDTVYSKKWVLSVLLHMMKDERDGGEFCGNGNDGTKEKDSHEPDEEKGAKKTNQDSKDDDGDEERDEKQSSNNELSPALEQELCELWDMTMDSDVSRYLLAEGAIDLILEVILNNSSLRKLEICMGILANMACTAEVCKEMVEHPRLSEVTLFHINNPDVRTLAELARFIGVCLSNKETRGKWIKILKDRAVVEKLIFILENSLNFEVLDGVAEIVDQLCDYDDEILDDLSSTKMVTTLCDVYRSTAVKHPQTVQALLHILQLISTTEKGVSSLVAVKDSGDIAEIILIQGSKYFTPLQSNFPSLVSSCCILNVLISSNAERKRKFNKKDLKILLTVMSLIEELLYNSNATGDQLRVFKTYSEAVLDFAVVLVEQLVDAEVSENMVSRLKEREKQIDRIISFLKKMPKHSETVKKLLDALQKCDVLRERVEGTVEGESNESQRSRADSSDETESEGENYRDTS